MAITCPNCSAELPDDAVFCDQCGHSLSRAPASPAAAAPPLAASEAVCPQCGAATIPGEAFCDNCGASLAEPAIAEPPTPAAAPVAEPAPAAEAPASDLTRCPACGADNLPSSRFCANCGLSMQPAVEAPPEPVAEPEPTIEPAAEPEPTAEAEPAPAPVVEPEPPAPTGQPRFVVRDTGAEIILPTAEGDYVIGREDPVSGVFPEIDMNPYEGEHYGVSRRHALLTIQAGLVFVQDLDSTNFTFVDRQKLAPRTPTALSNGDEVRFGKLVLTFLE